MLRTCTCNVIIMFYSCIQSPGYFEAACESRIQQFDDSDGESEEEDTSTWTDKEVSFTSPMDRNR